DVERRGGAAQGRRDRARGPRRTGRAGEHRPAAGKGPDGERRAARRDAGRVRCAGLCGAGRRRGGRCGGGGRAAVTRAIATAAARGAVLAVLATGACDGATSKPALAKIKRDELVIGVEVTGVLTAIDSTNIKPPPLPNV